MLRVAQPAVTRAVQQLEAELGFRLFDRTTRRVALTPAGDLFAREASDILRRLEATVHEAERIAAGKSGQLVIAYSPQATTGAMPKLVVGFRERFPNAEILLLSLSSDETVVALNLGQVDFGFLISEACGPPLHKMIIARERMVLLLSQNHPLAQAESLALKDLAALPFVAGTTKRWGSFRTLIDNACLKAGFLPTVVEETNDLPVLFQLLALQRGVALFGASVSSSLPADIKAVPITDEHACFDMCLAWLSADTPLAKAFVDLAHTMTEVDETGKEEGGAA